jgi:hypothetical protein
MAGIAGQAGIEEQHRPKPGARLVQFRASGSGENTEGVGY